MQKQSDNQPKRTTNGLSTNVPSLLSWRINSEHNISNRVYKISRSWKIKHL